MAGYPKCLLCDSRVSRICGTVYHSQGKQPPCCVEALKPSTNSDYAAAVNDLHKLHSDVSLASLPYGGSWLDRIENIINHLNAAKRQHSV